MKILPNTARVFCALYVATEEDSWEQKQVPERRPKLEERRKVAKKAGDAPKNELPYPVHRCSVCGYLCAANNPPRICPICKAGKERFERFM